MQTQPLVSVVIPTCNRWPILSRCLTALTVQTYSRLEVIVVDDASTDGTPEQLQKFADKFPNLTLRWFRNDRHLGANPSRNRGVREANGSLIAFEDSDCIAEPDWIEKLVARFDSDSVGAVVGLVKDPDPTNIFELTFRGTHRVAGREFANRLVGCNMCVRKDVLLASEFDEDRGKTALCADGTPDVTVSGRGDEEALFLFLRANGYQIRVAYDAVVLHEHFYTARSFFRQAYRGGGAAARLVYKFRLPTRLDMLPFILAYVSLILGLIDYRLVAVPAFFMVGALAAITYNDLFRKRKTLGESVRSFPMLIVYYHVRLAGYVWQGLRLRLGLDKVGRERISRAMKASR